MNKRKINFKSLDKNSLALLIITILVFVVMGILSPRSFLSVRNLQGMGIQFAEFGVLAFGMMLAMISGGIDLSLVGIANLSSIVAAYVMINTGNGNTSIVLGIIAALSIGCLCGIFNGFMIGYLQIPPMLVTLCGLQLFTGIGLVITQGPAITGLPENFALLANGTIAKIPISVLIFTVAAIFINFILKYTVYGQHLCFMGSNTVAAKYSGINNFKITLKTYGLSGIMGGIGGILMSSHYNSAKSDYGTTYTLLTLLIVVLGGTHPDGGKGKVLGVTLSIIVLQVISSTFNILRINSFIKTFVYGLILIIVMVAMEYDKRKK
ncbi:MAG: ABC transporter permease [Lachnospirales bacterium]